MEETFQPCRLKPSGYDTRICRRTGPSRRQDPEAHLEWFAQITFSLCVPQVPSAGTTLAGLAATEAEVLGHITYTSLWYGTQYLVSWQSLLDPSTAWGVRRVSAQYWAWNGQKGVPALDFLLSLDRVRFIFLYESLGKQIHQE